MLFACEISLDGMPEYHDKFRGNAKSFEKAMETYDMLAALQEEDPRLRIHSISTATNENMERDPAAHELPATSAARRWTTTTSRSSAATARTRAC